MAGDPSNPMAGSPQMAFVNGTQLKEVTSAAGVTAGAFYYDKASRRFTIGTNPNGATVELASRATALVPSATTSIKGLGFRRYASNEYNNNTEAPVIIGGANSLIENSVFWQNAGYGAGVSNSQGAIIRSSQFISNGFNGFTANGHHAGSTVDNMLIENSVFDSNNTEKFGTGCGLSCAQAGAKLSHMNGGVIKNNKFTNNLGQGFWCDLYCTNFTITGNYFSGNTATSLMYEVSANSIIASNVVIGGEYGVRIAGPNAKFYNNTVLNPGRMALWVYDDPRTPSGSEIPADTTNVEVGNNILQGGTDFMLWLEGHQTTWSQLESYSDFNSFYRPSGKPTVGFKYGTNGTDSYANTVADYHTKTGKETNSKDISNNTNPYFINASTGDYHIRSDSSAYRAGKPLASDVAAAIGVTAGQTVDVGALSWVGSSGQTTTTPPPPATDTTKPVTAISSPANNSAAKDTITITGSATDNVAVVKVELLVDGAVKATDSAAPFASFSWDTKTVADGSHSLSIKAYDAAGNSATSAAVTITITNTTPPPLPVITSVIATPAVITAGSTSMLSWVTQNVSTCDVIGGTTNTKATSWVTPVLTTVGAKTYTLTCYNTAVQSVSKTVSITVNAAPTAPTKPIFTADKTTVQSGGMVTFNWSSTGATSCVFNPGNIGGAAVVNGKVVSNITATTTYTLSCQNAVGSTQANPITISVTASPVPVALPVITSFAPDKANIGSGQSTTLRWNTTGVIVSGCRINPGTDQPANGSITTGDLVTSMSYTLTCKNSEDKTVSATTSVTVAGNPAPPAPVIVTPVVTAAQASAPVVTDKQSGAQVANASVTEQVSGLASLDISNVVDATKEQAIVAVEYYDGEKLIQKVTSPPFALNTKLLKNGSYTITERTYYIDGTQGEVTKVLGVSNQSGQVAGAKDDMSSSVYVGLFVLLIAIVVVGTVTRHRWLPALVSGTAAVRGRFGSKADSGSVSAAQEPPTQTPIDDPDTIIIRPDNKEQ